jgi:hypothetical protein
MPNLYSYGAWDGTQHVLDLDPKALLDAMSETCSKRVTCGALQRLFRQGAQNQSGQHMPGLQDYSSSFGNTASNSSSIQISTTP